MGSVVVAWHGRSARGRGARPNVYSAGTSLLRRQYYACSLLEEEAEEVSVALSLCRVCKRERARKQGPALSIFRIVSVECWKANAKNAAWSQHIVEAGEMMD